jgi:hypothetical protein
MRMARSIKNSNPKTTPNTIGRTGVECFEELAALVADGVEVADKGVRSETDEVVVGNVKVDEDVDRELVVDDVDLLAVGVVVEKILLLVELVVELKLEVVVSNESSSVVCGATTELKNESPALINESRS